MHIFHKWSKWEIEKIDVISTMKFGPTAGKPIEATIERQIRICSVCGYTQKVRIT